MNWYLKWRLYQLREWVSLKVTYLLPIRIVYLAFFRVMGYATSGKYGHEYPLDLKAFDAIARFGDDHGIR